MVVVLLLYLLCGIARHDNFRREEAMAEMYLRKIWVAGDHTGGYYGGISFCFLKMRNRKCQGWFSPEGLCQIRECFQTEDDSGSVV